MKPIFEADKEEVYYEDEEDEDFDDEGIALNTMKITFEHAIKTATE